MILGFKERFVTPILSGTKIHTIRADTHNRWKAGNKIHFATGIRTPQYKQFHEGVCTSVEPILLCNVQGSVVVYIDEVWKYVIEKLTANDGLSYNEFRDWFVPNNGDEFTGKIIHWTDFRYKEQDNE